MARSARLRSLLCAAAWSGAVGCGSRPGGERPLGSLELNASGAVSQVVTIDHRIPHASTVPANRGEAVELFLRERDGSNRENGTVVLMIHGRSVPVLPGAELDAPHYDWALWLARSGGFDVFMLDLQGSGRSPRPKMDDPCNAPRFPEDARTEADPLNQQPLLVPNPLPATCQHSYSSPLNTIESDLDEIDAAVEYIRDLRGDETKVHLVSWSQGSWRAGPYARLHPDKVASLFFFAPIFNKGFVAQPRQPQVPMTLTTRAGFLASWDAELDPLRCARQREDGIEDLVWKAIMDDDELGRTWGPPPDGAPAGSAPEGVMRVRNALLSPGSWNSTVAKQIKVPTAIVQGQFDTGSGARQDVAQLYDDIDNPNKLRFRVQCAGHFLNWETQRRVLHHVSKEWIKNGEVGGFTNGEFFVDTEGNLLPCDRAGTTEPAINRCAGEP